MAAPLRSVALAVLCAGSAAATIFIVPGGMAALGDRGQTLRLLIFLLEGTFISVLAGRLHAARAHVTNRGSTFTVTLPMLPMEETESSRGPVALPDLSGKTVLIVEDDPNARRVLAALVEQCGATAIATTSVDEALERWQSDRPTVILADIAMADKDGFELIRRVRERDADTPAIAVSAIHTSQNDREQLLAAGYTEFRRKPVSPDDLAWVIARTRGEA